MSVNSYIFLVSLLLVIYSLALQLLRHMTTCIATFHCIMPTLNDKWMIQTENLLRTYCVPDPFVWLKPQSDPHLIDKEARLREMKWLVKEHDSDSIPFLLTSDSRIPHWYSTLELEII